MRSMRYATILVTMIFCFVHPHLFAQPSVAQLLDSFSAESEQMWATPWKLTFELETSVYYSSSTLGRFLPEGKVEILGPKVQYLKSSSDPTVISESRAIAKGTYDAGLQMALTKKTSQNTLYLVGSRYRLESSSSENRKTIICFDGTETQQLQRSRTGIWAHQKYPGNRPGILEPLGFAFPKRIRLLEHSEVRKDGDLYRLVTWQNDTFKERWFDPQKNLIMDRSWSRKGDITRSETFVHEVVKVGELHLPGSVEYKKFHKDGKPEIHIRAWNMQWEILTDYEDVFKVKVPHGTIMSKDPPREK